MKLQICPVAITHQDLVAAELDAFRPDVLYLPWRGERNPDHHALHVGALRAIDRGSFAGVALGYEI